MFGFMQQCVQPALGSFDNSDTPLAHTCKQEEILMDSFILRESLEYVTFTTPDPVNLPPHHSRCLLQGRSFIGSSRMYR